MRFRLSFAVRIMAWGGIALLASGSLPAQVFEPIGDVGYNYGVANAGRIKSIVPVTSSRIYVGASDGGVWRSLDGGVHWTTPTDLFSSLMITALAADPSGMRVFAATKDPVRLLRSDDGLSTVTVAIDTTPLQLGASLHFVIRAVNGCPSGDGTLGNDSDGKERAGRACP